MLILRLLQNSNLYHVVTKDAHHPYVKKPFCWQERIRTSDARLFRPTLYQLSYLPIIVGRERLELTELRRDLIYSQARLPLRDLPYFQSTCGD